MRRPTILLLLSLAAVPPAAAQRIECTQAAFEQAIANANASGGNVTITFNCSNTRILLDSARDGNRLITAGNVTIDGENRGIVFEQNPPWWDDRLDACGGTNCDPDGDNVPNACADTEGASMFLNLQGNGITVRNLTFNYFWEGIHMGRNGGSLQTLDNVACENPGDDCVSNPTNTGDRLVIRNSRFTNTCDKAVQVYGRPNGTSTSTTDVTIENSTFTNTVQPIRAPYSGGRHRFVGNTIRESGASGVFYCDGPRFDGSAPVVVYFEANLVEGCRRGLRVGGGVEAMLRGNTFRANDLRGVAVYGSARASFDGNSFENNGGSSSSESYYGGLAVAQTAMADAGGGNLTIDGTARTSPGNNTFSGNRSPTDATQDVSNATTSEVRAENNWWSDTNPSDQISGSVDYQPFLSAPPSGGGGNTEPPQQVQAVRRTDRR